MDLVEFSYNNSYQVTIQMAPFEALYGCRCRSPVYWDDFTEAVNFGPSLLLQMTKQVKLIRDRMKVAQDRLKSYVDLKRRPEEFNMRSSVVMTIADAWSCSFWWKLSPSFIGPYEISE